MCQWLIAKFYDRIMQDAEDKGLREWRTSLLKGISGDVLEIGAGTGANFPFYSSAVNRLILSELNIFMRNQLEQKILSPFLWQCSVEILSDEAECLSLPDESVDAVVCTLVLCSVKNPEKALDGCHITRETEKVIIDANFKFLEIQRQSMRGVPAIVRPSIRGIAVKKQCNLKKKPL